jgi:hypothetical protein
MRHEILRSQNFREDLIKRQRGVFPVPLSRNSVPGLFVIEIVSQSNAISRSNRQHLVFAITIECSPLNLLGISTPIKFYFSTRMTDSEFAARVGARETHDERSELILCARRIDMRLELVMWPLVDLISAQMEKVWTLSLYSSATIMGWKGSR